MKKAPALGAGAQRVCPRLDFPQHSGCASSLGVPL